MPIDPESQENFQRAAEGDSLLGVVRTDTNVMYLALAERQDGAQIDPARHSVIGHATRDPLPPAGGHGMLATWAGVPDARQVGQGQAEGNAFGFSIVKTRSASSLVKIYSYRSGFNGQDRDAKRPGFTQSGDDRNRLRTLDEERILYELMPLLSSAGYFGSTSRRKSF